MSAVERLEERRGETPPRHDLALAEAPSIEAELTELPAKSSARLRPLLALMPYVGRYRGRAILAFIGPMVPSALASSTAFKNTSLKLMVRPSQALRLRRFAHLHCHPTRRAHHDHLLLFLIHRFSQGRPCS